MLHKLIGSGSIVFDCFGAPIRQSRNLDGLLRHASGRGVRQIHVDRLNDYGRPGALVTIHYQGGHKGLTYFVCGSHAVDWAQSKRNDSPRRSWFAGCEVTTTEHPAGSWEYA